MILHGFIKRDVLKLMESNIMKILNNKNVIRIKTYFLKKMVGNYYDLIGNGFATIQKKLLSLQKTLLIVKCLRRIAVIIADS